MNRRTDRATPRVRRCGTGYAAEGPGFFVWDRDSRAVADAAQLLQHGAVPTRTPARLLMLRVRRATSADSEALDA